MNLEGVEVSMARTLCHLTFSVLWIISPLDHKAKFFIDNQGGVLKNSHPIWANNSRRS